MKIFLIVLLSICSTLTSLAQDCNFDGKLDWTKVQVLEVESKDAPKGFVITGESTLKISKPIKSISDLNEHQLKRQSLVYDNLRRLPFCKRKKGQLAGRKKNTRKIPKCFSFFHSSIKLQYATSKTTLSSSLKNMSIKYSYSSD